MGEEVKKMKLKQLQRWSCFAKNGKNQKRNENSDWGGRFSRCPNRDIFYGDVSKDGNVGVSYSGPASGAPCVINYTTQNVSTSIEMHTQ